MEFKQLIKERRSVRAYKADTVILPETIEEIMKDAQMAPTWKNSQTGRYYIAATPEKFESVKACLPAFNQNSSANASALVVTTYVKGIAGHTNMVPDNELGDKWGTYDLGLSNAYFILAAKNAGYDTLIMGIRDGEAIAKVLGIPEEEEVVSVIALGKAEKEPFLRPRKETGEIYKLI